MSTFFIVASVASILITAFAAVTDMRSGLIPNWITFPPLFLAPIAHAVFVGWSSAAWSLGTIFLCGAMPWVIFQMNGMGGGDVKLFTALGAIWGPQVGLQVEFYSLLAGALVSIVLLARQGRLRTLFRNTGLILLNMVLPKARRKEIVHDERDKLRLGAAIFVGNLYVVVYHLYVFRKAWL